MRSRTLLRILEAPKPRASIATSPQPQKKPWRKFVTPNGLVVGIPDRVEASGHGVKIIDFKTGLSSDTQASAFEDYVLQMKIYAALFHAAAEFWPSQLELHGLDGSVHIVPFGTTECANLLAEAEQLARSLAETTANLTDNASAQIQIASPGGETCRFCAFRPACPAYLLASFSSTTPCETDVCGILKGWKTLGNGELLVELEGRAGNARIRNLPSIPHIIQVLQSSALGQKMIIFNVLKNEDASPLYSPTAYTALHAYIEGEV